MNVEKHPPSKSWGSGAGKLLMRSLVFSVWAKRLIVGLPYTQHISLNTRGSDFSVDIT